MNEKTFSTKTTSTTADRLAHYGLPLLLLLSLLLLFGLIVDRAVQRTAALQSLANTVSTQTLADQYGIEINLLAVTAAGGLVDLRMKVLDAAKAELLFQDSNDAPTLRIGDSKTILTLPEESQSDLLNNLNDGSHLYLLFPNANHVVRPGMSVTIMFGGVTLEPMMAQ